MGFGAGGFGGVEEVVEELALFGLADAVLVEPAGALAVEEGAVGVAAQARHAGEDRRERGQGLRDGVFAWPLELFEDLFEGAEAALFAICLLLAPDSFIESFPF